MLFLSFQVDGYQVSPAQKVKLSYEIDGLDPQGVKLMETVKDTVEAELAPQDKNWQPKIRHSIATPPLGPPGAYKIVVRVKDELAGSTASKEIPFQIRAHEVARSDTLVVRNFHFFRTEDDREPLSPAVYRPGDSVWARFDITGYKLGDGNRKDVQYGIAVAAPSGKVLFTQPEAAVEQSASFYPQRYVPGSFNLTLQPNIRPGEYSIVLTVRDRIGNQTIEDKETFRIE